MEAADVELVTGSAAAAVRAFRARNRSEPRSRETWAGLAVALRDSGDCPAALLAEPEVVYALYNNLLEGTGNAPDPNVWPDGSGRLIRFRSAIRKFHLELDELTGFRESHLPMIGAELLSQRGQHRVQDLLRLGGLAKVTQQAGEIRAGEERAGMMRSPDLRRHFGKPPEQSESGVCLAAQLEIVGQAHVAARRSSPALTQKPVESLVGHAVERIGPVMFAYGTQLDGEIVLARGDQGLVRAVCGWGVGDDLVRELRERSAFPSSRSTSARVVMTDSV